MHTYGTFTISMVVKQPYTPGVDYKYKNVQLFKLQNCTVQEAQDALKEFKNLNPKLLTEITSCFQPHSFPIY